MRIGAAFFLALALTASEGLPGRADSKGDEETPRERSPRGTYLLRQIFGDLPRSEPSLEGVVPGIRRREIPPGTDLGEKVESLDSPSSFVKEISGRATVTFVFDGPGDDARLHHITVTLAQAPNITSKAVLAHLTRIYGPPDPDPPGGIEEILGSWQKGAILSRHFPSARFFEVTLTPPHPLSEPSP